MDVFVIGISGKVGGLLAQELRSRGDAVRGLVRRDAQRTELAADGIETVVGDLATMTPEELAETYGAAGAAARAPDRPPDPRAERRIDPDPGRRRGQRAPTVGADGPPGPR